MIKVFISQAMNGRSDEEILAEREKAIVSIRKRYNDDVEVLDTFFDFPEGTPPLYYLAKSIEALSQADVAYFCKGWETARGCRIENQCAIDYDLECIEDYTKG